MPDATLTILPDEPLGTVSPLLHGHFAEHLGRCCNDGLWVGRDSAIPNDAGLRSDVMAALRSLGVPSLRWPGGCYADTYHWRDGIGESRQRPRTLGESCGLNVVEDNGLGTHEFIRLCREVGAEPYLAGNLGSGSPQEMMDWIHYCNGTLDTSLVRERAANGHPEPMNVRYWGVGNENWGCGGSYDPVDYAKEFRRYSTFLKMADPAVQLVACGHCDRDWNLKVVETLRNHLSYLDHLSVHRYYNAGPATAFDEGDYYKAMRAGPLIEEDIRFTSEILRYFAAGKRDVKIAFDEWGIWHPESVCGSGYEAPSTLRDAVAAAGVLDVFHRQCSRLSMANLAQVVNVLQCLICTEDDRMCLTPTYHLFQIYKPHRGLTALRCVIGCPTVEAPGLCDMEPESLELVSASASLGERELVISVTNRHYTDAMELRVQVRDRPLGRVSVQTLSASSPAAVNSFQQPANVNVTHSEATARGNTLHLTLPACSVTTVVGL